MRKLSRPECPNQVALSSGDYKNPENKRTLRDASFDKCMYCEAKISHAYYGDIEHIKPRSKFPELEFEWQNLGYVCAVCNGKKSDKYDETTPFIDPYNEPPEEHIIALGAFVRHKKGSERGEITIHEELGIDLNRIALVERRMEKIKHIEKAIDACARTSNEQLREMALNELKKEAENDKEYSLCIKTMLEIHGLQ